MDELAKRFADLAAQYGPSVVDAALGAARTEGYSYLAASVLEMIAAIVLAFGAQQIWRMRPALRTEPFAENIGRGALSTAAGVCVVIAGFLVFEAVWNWLDPWTWAAIGHPELWLAKKALKI